MCRNLSTLSLSLSLILSVQSSALMSHFGIQWSVCLAVLGVFLAAKLISDLIVTPAIPAPTLRDCGVLVVELVQVNHR